jgi:hypothetical protein
LVVWNMNFIFPYVGNVIIPTDFHIFQRDWNHQPVFVFFAQSYVDSSNRVDILVSEVLLRWLLLKFFGPWRWPWICFLQLNIPYI